MEASAHRPLLEMREIEKRFPGVHALKGVSLDVDPGEVHVLLGENGAGKSTLIKVLSGAYAPDSGEIRIDGLPVVLRNPHDAQARGISTLYQEFNLALDLSVAENVFLGREPLRNRFLGIVDRGRLVQKTRRLLESLDIRIEPEAIAGTLGVAEQQMVEIAKALSLEARIIVMDEPTATLTSHEIDRLFATIRELVRRGVAILYISHRLDEVAALGRRATVLRDGSRVGTVSVRETPLDELVRMMVGRELEEKFPKVHHPPAEEALRVEGLTRRGVFHDVSFHLRRGEILGIAGLVGSKRTETARAIFGADELDSGRIYVHGEPVEIETPADAIRHGIALVPEDRKRHGIVTHLTVRENITLSALARFARRGFLDAQLERKEAGAYVDRLRIATPDLERRVFYLSGGNQQKVVIAKWMATEADIFLFDEPTRGIDVRAKVEVYELMGELVARGAAIVMISSELPDILGMCDRILVMREGRITGELARDEATEEAILDYALGRSRKNGEENGMRPSFPWVGA